jgi:hypothetical protein
MSLWQAANIYKVSMTLFALEEVGVLACLAAGPRTPATLAADQGLEREALEPLLELMVEAGVLARVGQQIQIDPQQAALLPLVALEGRMAGTRITSAKLVAALRGAPLGDPMIREGADALWPVYVAAMSVGARSLSPHLMRFARPAPGTRLLDLGGSDGSLGHALANMLPGLEVTVVDRPTVAEAFERRRGASEDAARAARFRFVGADLKRPDSWAGLLGQSDLVVASNVMHLLTGAEREDVLRAVKGQARPGTTIVVYDQFVQPGVSDSARCLVVDWLLCGYRFDLTDADFAETLEKVGFSAVRSRRVPGLPGAMLAACV